MAHCERRKTELKKAGAGALRTPLPRSKKRTDEIKKAGSPSSVDGGSGRG